MVLFLNESYIFGKEYIYNVLFNLITVKIFKKERDNNETQELYITQEYLGLFLELKIRSTKGLII